MKIRFSVPLALSCLMMLFILSANILCAQELVSTDPRYAAVVLPEFGGKNVLVIFDESAGTGKGYDTVYVDANLDGVMSKDEKYAAEPEAPSLGNGVYHSFRFIALNPSVKTLVSYRMSFIYSRFGPNENFNIVLSRDMQYKGKTWSVPYSSKLMPSKDSAKPFIFQPVYAPKAIIKSGPFNDETGVAIKLVSGDIEITPAYSTVTLTVKNSAGKIVKKTSGNIYKFCFG